MTLLKKKIKEVNKAMHSQQKESRSKDILDRVSTEFKVPKADIQRYSVMLLGSLLESTDLGLKKAIKVGNMELDFHPSNKSISSPK